MLRGRVVHRVGGGEDDPRSEAAQQLGDALADAPEADETDRGARQLPPEELLGLPADPLAAAEDPIGLDHPPAGASMSATASSAVASVRTSGVFVARSPRSRTASVSMLS